MSTTPLQEVANQAGVGYRWLQMFKKGQIPDPGYSRVKLLADYFMRVGMAPVLREDATHQRHQQT